MPTGSRFQGILPDRAHAICLLVFVVLSSLLVAAMTHATKPLGGERSVFGLNYMVGPATQSLLEGHSLLVCTEDMGTPGNPICFRGARMPVASAILAVGVEVFGDRPKRVIFLRNMLFLLPLWVATALFLGRVKAGGRLLAWCGVLLLSPLFIPNYLAIVVNPAVEEGYLFSIIALAIVLLFASFDAGWGWIVCYGLTLDLLFLTKSSMLGAVFVLFCSALAMLPSWTKRAALAAFVCLAPLGWGIYQHHATGRFALGTSLDGLNLEKGNNAKFQSRYPPAAVTLDVYDRELNQGTHFSDEWEFNDFHMARAKQFIRTHPGYTLVSAGKKADLIFLTLNDHRVTSQSWKVSIVASAGMVLFRLLLWSSLAVSVYSAWTGRWIGRGLGLTYLCFVAAYAAPYIAGFGYMRHAIILAYPSAVVCCLALIAWQRTGGATAVEVSQSSTVA